MIIQMNIAYEWSILISLLKLKKNLADTRTEKDCFCHARNRSGQKYDSLHIIFKPYCATSRISKEIFILSAWQKSGVFLISSEHKNVGDIFTIVSLMYLKSFADVMCWIIFMNQAFFGKLQKLILEKMPFFCQKKNVFKD
jgi:hypothetical protein